MKEIKRNRFRPVLVTIFWCSFIFNGVDVDHLDGNYLPEIFLVILLISMLIFKIREKISIEDDFLLFNLQKSKIKIALDEIQEISFNDYFNKINIRTATSSLTLNIDQFQSKEVETFFVKNELYKPETEEQIKHNKSPN